MPDEGVDVEDRLVGFDNAHEAELNRTCAVLQDSRRLLLELTQIQLHGRRFPALRPSASSGVPLFGIALDFLPSTVVSTLVPDVYSGRILREVGQNVLTAPEIWGEIVAEGWSDGVRTHIFINGSLVELDDLPDRVWSSLEIECTKGIAYQTDHEIRVDAMAGTAGLCLDLVLAGLDLDEFHEPVEAEVAGDLEVWLEPGIQNEGSGCSVQVGGKVRDSGILRGRRRDRPAEGSDQTRGKNAGSSLPGIRVTRHGWPAPVDHRP